MERASGIGHVIWFSSSTVEPALKGNQFLVTRPSIEPHNVRRPQPRIHSHHTLLASEIREIKMCTMRPEPSQIEVDV